jgi:hypothetical protein
MSQPFQNYRPVGLIRSAAILTNSYVAATTISDDVESYNQLILYVAYVKGSLTSLELKVEFSHDGSTFFQDANKSVSSGTSTVSVNEYTFAPSGDSNMRIAIPIKDKYIKVSAKGTGTVTSSSCSVFAILGVA